MSNFWGIVLILAGLSIMFFETVSVGLGVQTEVHGSMKYLAALPEIALGVYILYLNSQG